MHAMSACVARDGDVYEWLDLNRSLIGFEDSSAGTGEFLASLREHALARFVVDGGAALLEFSGEARDRAADTMPDGIGARPVGAPLGA